MLIASASSRLGKRGTLAATLALLLAGAMSPAIAALHGAKVGDINRDGDACTDFFDYANGAWRAAHPIPNYMDRWSRRWESGEINKEHVRDILTEVSARQDWPVGSAEQLSGDFYAACMNEAAVNKLGIAPLQPWLDEVRSLKDIAGVQRLLGSMHDVGVQVPFAVLSGEDPHDPTRTIAHVYATGLGMPDRDYYLKLDPRFVEARAKYHQHVAKMFVLAGAKPTAAKQRAASVFAFEKQLAEASLDNVSLRDPRLQDHMTGFADLSKLMPSFDWSAYFDAAKMPKNALNVTQPDRKSVV